jgi:4-amino-4-deoxy-L-arabinose transferase-like glycosyltransferase
MMKKILQKIHCPPWVCILLALVLILRIPSFFEPYSYGDEMIYVTLGEGIRQGVTLYKNLHDNKPPLLYLLAATAGNLFWFKVILAFWNLATIILFWNLVKVLFAKNEKIQKVATVIFALLTTIPLLEGNIVNAELFMIGPIIIAFLILFTQKLNIKNLLLSGFLFGIATLFKVPAAFDLPVIVLFWLITEGLNKENVKKVVKNTIFLTIGFLAPILITLVWYYFQGALGEYLSAAFLQNVGYISTWRPSDVQKPFLVRNLPLLIRAGIVLLGTIILYLRRMKLSKKFIFLSLWLILGLFAVTLSERPYPHYLIQIIPSFSLLLAILFADKTMEQSLVIIPLALAFFVPVYYRFWYYPTTPYYFRFVKFISGNLNKNRYFNEFGSTTTTNYKIADFLVKSSQKTDRIFIWGPDSPTIYALSRRLPPVKFVAEYHINEFTNKEEVAKSLSQANPKFIIRTSNATPFQELNILLKSKYVLINTIDGAEVWSSLTLPNRK